MFKDHTAANPSLLLSSPEWGEGILGGGFLFRWTSSRIKKKVKKKKLLGLHIIWGATYRINPLSVLLTCLVPQCLPGTWFLSTCWLAPECLKNLAFAAWGELYVWYCGHSGQCKSLVDVAMIMWSTKPENSADPKTISPACFCALGFYMPHTVVIVPMAHCFSIGVSLSSKIHIIPFSNKELSQMWAPHEYNTHLILSVSMQP